MSHNESAGPSVCRSVRLRLSQVPSIGSRKSKGNRRRVVDITTVGEINSERSGVLSGCVETLRWHGGSKVRAAVTPVPCTVSHDGPQEDTLQVNGKQTKSDDTRLQPNPFCGARRRRGLLATTTTARGGACRCCCRCRCRCRCEHLLRRVVATSAARRASEHRARQSISHAHCCRNGRSQRASALLPTALSVGNSVAPRRIR